MQALNWRSSKRLSRIRLATLMIILAGTSGTASAELVNVSTRALVQGGDKQAIAGFVIDSKNLTPGTNPGGSPTQQCVVVRGRGPSVGVSGEVLPDPYLRIVSNGVELDANDDWGDHPFAPAVQASGKEPGDPKDAAIYTCLDPGPYTALLSPNGNGSGIGLVEVVKVPYFDVSEILSVQLTTDVASVLVGDYLDVSASPTVGGSSSYDSETRTLTVDRPSVGTAALWADALKSGSKFDIQANVTNFSGSIIKVKSGGIELMSINGNGSYDFRGAVVGNDLRIDTNGASDATIALSVRDIVTVSWNVTNAESCDTFDSDPFTTEWDQFVITPGADGTAQGSLELTANFNSETTYSYGLRCTDSGAKQVTDEAPIVATFCFNAGPVSIIDWDDLQFGVNKVDGFNFPEPSGNTAVISMPPGTTKAVRFNTSTVLPEDYYGALKNPEVAGSGELRQISISRCPGQFEDLPVRCSSIAVSSGQVLFDIDNSRPELTSVCRLEKGATGETYYFNIKFDDGCSGSSTCYTKVLAQ